MAEPDVLGQGIRELAADLGVSLDYWDWQGRYTPVSTRTVRGVLHGLGVEVTTDEQAWAALEERRLHRWRQMLPPCVVMRSGGTRHVPVHVPHGSSVEVVVELEDGSVGPTLEQLDRWVEPVEVDGRFVGEATYGLPPDLPLGYHTLRATSGTLVATSQLVVTPAWLGLPPQLDGQRVWGLMAQLYALRSRNSWGIGDLRDLSDLCSWAGRTLGAGFVLVNPLHAAEPIPPVDAIAVPPGHPALRQPAVPAGRGHPRDRGSDQGRPSRRRAARGSAAAAVAVRRSCWTATRPGRPSSACSNASPRCRSHRTGRPASRPTASKRASGSRTSPPGARSRRRTALVAVWPDALADHRGQAVAAERVRLADRVEVWTRVQWWVDEQLARAQASATAAGMPLGIVHDLAVGVHPDGADAWALAEVLASGCTVGAPPDAFNQVGQDWSQPPWRPDALAEVGYAPFRDMIRTVLRHAGGLRVDHVLGLFRLWWVPEGQPADEGAYVPYDHEALVGILALEAHRAGAVVIGEDLGTVEPWMRDHLRERGILGTSILWFERDGHASRCQPDQWREFCLATVTTHDLPPTAGYLAGEHLAIRERLGLLTRPVEEERAASTRPAGGLSASTCGRQGLLGEDDVLRGDCRGAAPLLGARRRPGCSASRCPTSWGTGAR